MIRAELKVASGKHQGKIIPLTTRKFLVGREQDCQLRPSSELVSRHHCVFTVDDYTVRLRDLGSTNGTFRNGERVEGTVVLEAGDRITIGKLELDVNIRELTEAEVTAAKASRAPVEPPPENVLADSATIPAYQPESQATQETSIDMPAFQPGVGSGVYGGDTAIFPVGQFPGQPGYSPGMYPGVPAAQYMPMMYPQMPYAPQYGYPQMPYPQYPPQTPAPAQPASSTASSDSLPVRLPPPEATGVQAAPVAAEGAAPKPASSEEKPSQKAADIIRQYMNRR